MTKIDKKGQAGIGGLSNTAITLMVTGIVLMFSVILVSQIGQSEVVRGTLVNASDPTEGYTNDGTDIQSAYNDTLDSVVEFSGWLPTVAILAVAGLIIYIVVRSFPRVQ